MSQHWYPSQFTNPSVAPFAHPMSFYWCRTAWRTRGSLILAVCATWSEVQNDSLASTPCNVRSTSHSGTIAKVKCFLVGSFGSMRVLSWRMLLWFQICISICFRFRNSFRMALRCALRPTYLEFLILREILFVRLSLLAVSCELIFLTPLALLDVWWSDPPLSFGSGIGDWVTWALTY